MRVRLIFLAVVVPLGVVGRPFWRRRLGLRPSTGARSYWRPRRDVVSVTALRTAP